MNTSPFKHGPTIEKNVQSLPSFFLYLDIAGAFAHTGERRDGLRDTTGILKQEGKKITNYTVVRKKKKKRIT